jgi:hypothetical protein
MMDSIYPSLTKNEGWRQTQKKQKQLMAKNLHSFGNTSYGRGGEFGRDAGNGSGSKNLQSIGNSHFGRAFGQDAWGRPSDPWNGIGSKNSQPVANSPYGRSFGQDAENGIGLFCLYGLCNGRHKFSSVLSHPVFSYAF